MISDRRLTRWVGSVYDAPMTYAELTLAQKALYDESNVRQTENGPSLVLAGGNYLQKKYPHLTFQDDDWKPVSALLLRFVKFQTQPSNVKEYAARGEQQVVSRSLAPNSPSGSRGQGVRANPAVPQARVVAQKVPAVGVEARIRELAGARLAEVAKLNKVNPDIHPTNPGITAMRRKNALLALHRRGSAVKL